jgi:nucleoside-diphosphate-sugar epimerase
VIRKSAILGANGFVGFRTFESWIKSSNFSPRAIVRRPGSLARISRFEADWRLADASDKDALIKAFEGCDYVINCVVGNAETIEASCLAAYEASSQAGVKRYIYLSSASVHGQSPPAGTTEESDLDDHQLYWYNNAKIRAERALKAAAERTPTECVILRPGIVWGPRSSWVGGLCDAIMEGQPAWLNDGMGICNSIYIDNLIHAIELAITQPREAVDGEAFLLNDPEITHWKDIYLPIISWFGKNSDDICNGIPQELPPRGFTDRIKDLKATSAGQAVLKVIPARFKETAKGGIRAWSAPQKPNPFALPPKSPPTPRLSPEMSQLFACQYRLPVEKAKRKLNYNPPLKRSKALALTHRWLYQAGYPVSAPGASASQDTNEF